MKIRTEYIRNRVAFVLLEVHYEYMPFADYVRFSARLGVLSRNKRGSLSSRDAKVRRLVVTTTHAFPASLVFSGRVADGSWKGPNAAVVDVPR